MANEQFRESLSHFTAEAAYAGAVRHLYDLGYSEEMIHERLTYPATLQQIRKVIADYEEKKQDPEKDYGFVQEVDACGRKSFRRVRNARERDGE